MFPHDLFLSLHTCIPASPTLTNVSMPLVYWSYTYKRRRSFLSRPDCIVYQAVVRLDDDLWTVLYINIVSGSVLFCTVGSPTSMIDRCCISCCLINIATWDIVSVPVPNQPQRGSLSLTDWCQAILSGYSAPPASHGPNTIHHLLQSSLFSFTFNSLHCTLMSFTIKPVQLPVY